MTDPTEEHQYLSTACVHGLMEGLASPSVSVSGASEAFHQACRLTCKWCAVPCACPCHEAEGVAS